jgi:uncharacterized membrane-anchored protein
MRKWLYLFTSLAVAAALNLLVVQKEHVLSHGDVIRLELRPQDPRSIMQGDYMTLNYTLSRRISNRSREAVPHRGRLVVRLDENRVARFERFDDGSPLAANERFLVYYKRDRRGGPWSLVFGSRAEIWPGPNAWFFQEGQDQIYAQARYAELRVSSSGQRVLTGLLDSNLEPLSP